ncbi:MAG: hypothetical protein IIA88_02660, partial [Bacteroidetes bacterium]|nr:hypothetical protein [Bacteroidota bacterium]
MKNLLLITVFLLGGCTCDNLGKKAKVVQGQKEDTLKRNSELIKSEHAEDSETTLKEKSNSDSPPLTPGPPESEKPRVLGGETERRKTKQFTDSPIHPFTPEYSGVRNSGRGAGILNFITILFLTACLIIP